MKRAAIGVSMHSGWGILVAVDEQASLIDRRRIVVATNDGPRGNQPYHRAQQLGLANAEKYLADYTAETDNLSRQVVARAISDLKTRGYRVTRAAILQASGRTLPDLAKILAAHPLIHTAEGELFRNTIRRACESLDIPVVGIRGRDLEGDAKKTLAAKVIKQLAQAGKALGPPWNADHKSAALAAFLVLQDQTASVHRP
jgi:hypothetical protein